MKKLFIALLFISMSLSAMAQVERVDIDMTGNYELTVRVGNGEYVVVDRYGQINYIDIDGPWSFYNDFWAYQAGKVSRVGNVEFSYNNDFWDYQAGKIKMIGPVSFSYYNDFWDYQTGKLSKVGRTSIEYYNDFWDYQVGKVKKIGNISIGYYSDTGFNGSEKYKGLLRSINGDQFSYSQALRRPVRLENSPMNRAGETDRNSGNMIRPGRGRPDERPSRGMQQIPGHQQHKPDTPSRPVQPNIRLEGRRQFTVDGVLIVVHDMLY